MDTDPKAGKCQVQSPHLAETQRGCQERLGHLTYIWPISIVPSSGHMIGFRMTCDPRRSNENQPWDSCGITSAARVIYSPRGLS